jgi:hypothetical protein
MRCLVVALRVTAQPKTDSLPSFAQAIAEPWGEQPCVRCGGLRKIDISKTKVREVVRVCEEFSA